MKGEPSAPLFLYGNNLNKRQIEKVKRVNQKLVEHFGIPKRNNKLPDPVDMIVATILSQNTNDNNSYKAFNNLKKSYKNWDEVQQADRRSIEAVIRVAGLGKQKSNAIKNLLSALKQKYGTISLKHISTLAEKEAIDELTSYNGVGVKTASCVLLFALDKNICPVDTHVHRTVNRIGIVSAKTPDKTFNALNENFPPKIAHQFHTNLIRLGREICKPAKPICYICPVKRFCKFESKTKSGQTSTKSNSFMLLDNV